MLSKDLELNILVILIQWEIQEFLMQNKKAYGET
jgi:hypothetical protein